MSYTRRDKKTARVCPGCGIEKPLTDEYWYRKIRPDCELGYGYQNLCKPCDKASARARRLAKREAEQKGNVSA